MKVLREIIGFVQDLLRRLVRGPEVVARERELEEILSGHAERVIEGETGTATLPARIPGDSELPALLSLAEQLGGNLYPVAPATGFQSRLLHDLMRQAHAQCEHVDRSLWEERRKEIIIGATITSIISAAGVVAYLMRLTPFNRPPTSTG